MAPKSKARRRVAGNVFNTLGAAALVLGLLWVASPVLIPITLSVLLAFILSPLVTALERWRLGRVPAVLIASLLAFSLIACCGWALFSQISSLAAELPSHRKEIKAKIAAMSAGENSTLSRLTAMFDDLTRSMDKQPSVAVGDSSAGGAVMTPVPVVVQSRNRSQLSIAVQMLLPVVEPLAQAAFIVVLVLFLLIQREDMRYRVISLMGDASLTGTTRLIRDTAERVSRYLLNLLLVNAGFGLWFGLGLYFLGVPYPALWGFLTLFFRFIPFVGSPASVLFPLLISIATSSGWGQPIAVAIFFLISEPFTANVIEPIVFGKTTGLTPIALLFAALFWAWIWGPIGLLLSTPLTVCLVVLGQHLPHLRSLKVLLAQQPALDARLQFFQRLLSGDAREGQRVFDAYVKQFGREKAYDDVIIPALRWTRRERLKLVITAAEEKRIYGMSAATVRSRGNIKMDALGTGEGCERSEHQVLRKLSVFGYPVHHDSEEIALLMLTEMLERTCDVTLATTKQLPSKVVNAIAAEKPDVVVLATIPPGGMPQVQFMCHEIRNHDDEVTIIVACFGKLNNYDGHLVCLRKAGASYLTTSLEQTKNQIQTLHEESWISRGNGHEVIHE
ncbi:MAG: AI-2E family transporter [Phycisphaera sp. RhM]|nr:AI-2E family transporter [Phycisphaera sp. RhM]